MHYELTARLAARVTETPKHMQNNSNVTQRCVTSSLLRSPFAPSLSTINIINYSSLCTMVHLLLCAYIGLHPRRAFSV